MCEDHFSTEIIFRLTRIAFVSGWNMDVFGTLAINVIFLIDQNRPYEKGKTIEK